MTSVGDGRGSEGVARRWLSRAALVLYLAFLLTLTLLILPGDHPKPNLVPFRSIVHDLRAGGRDFVVNFAGNLGAFLPLGVLIPEARRRPTGWRMVLLAGLLLSLGIEVGQFASGRRVGDVDDVLLNTLGTLAGFGLARWAGGQAGQRAASSRPSPQ